MAGRFSLFAVQLLIARLLFKDVVTIEATVLTVFFNHGFHGFHGIFGVLSHAWEKGLIGVFFVSHGFGAADGIARIQNENSMCSNFPAFQIASFEN